MSTKGTESAQKYTRWKGPSRRSWARKRTRLYSSHSLEVGDSLEDLILTIPDFGQHMAVEHNGHKFRCDMCHTFTAKTKFGLQNHKLNEHDTVDDGIKVSGPRTPNLEGRFFGQVFCPLACLSILAYIKVHCKDFSSRNGSFLQYHQLAIIHMHLSKIGYNS